MIRFGYKASAEQFAPGELADLAVLAEDSGFDSVFISDHLQPWRHDGGHAPAALPWLGALAARTDRVALGTSVLTPTFRYHPAVVAQAFATLGCLAPGPGHPRRRLRRVAQRGAARARVARRQGALRPPQGGGPADPAAVGRGPGHLRGRLLPARATPPSTTSPSSRCRSTSPRPARPPPGWPAGSPTASSPPAARAASSTPTRCCRPSPRARGRPARASTTST